MSCAQGVYIKCHMLLCSCASVCCVSAHVHLHVLLVTVHCITRGGLKHSKQQGLQ